VPERL